jgi:hypothetical protein
MAFKLLDGRETKGSVNSTAKGLVPAHFLGGGGKQKPTSVSVLLASALQRSWCAGLRVTGNNENETSMARHPA